MDGLHQRPVPASLSSILVSFFGPFDRRILC